MSRTNKSRKSRKASKTRRQRTRRQRGGDFLSAKQQAELSAFRSSMVAPPTAKGQGLFSAIKADMSASNERTIFDLARSGWYWALQGNIDDINKSWFNKAKKLSAYLNQVDENGHTAYDIATEKLQTATGKDAVNYTKFIATLRMNGFKPYNANNVTSMQNSNYGTYDPTSAAMGGPNVMR